MPVARSRSPLAPSTAKVRRPSTGRVPVEMGTADVTSKRSLKPRLVAAALLLPLVLAASGCGRRGSLEPPNAPVKTSAVSNGRSLSTTVAAGGAPPSDAAAVAAGDELAPTAVSPAGDGAPVETSRGAKRGYTIPKQSFILDPLL